MIDYLAHLAADAAALRAVAVAHPGAAVVHCPGWSVARLTTHVGRVYASMTNQLRSGALEPGFGEPAPLPDTDAQLGSWFDSCLEPLLAELAATDPARPLWSWSARHEAGFYHRRVAMETAVHRWDAQRAAGQPAPLAAELAADGVDEVLEVGMQHRRSGEPPHYPAGSLHLHRTDGPGEWLVVPVAGSLVVTHEHAKGDVAVRGSAAELLLYLWGRDEGAVESFGDPALVAAWAAVAP
jgi:uncharacterized protein (TIGR03083 family)